MSDLRYGFRTFALRKVNVATRRARPPPFASSFIPRGSSVRGLTDLREPANRLRLEVETMIAANSSRKRTSCLFFLATVLSVGLLASSSPSAAADVTPFTVPVPTVTGPIPSTSTNFPYIADGFSVEPPVPQGYEEQEYFVSGTGTLYEYTPTGIEIVTPCPAVVTTGCTGIPYTTRMLVKRPIDPHKFSGNVIIEPLNPSAGFDIAAVWDRSVNSFVRNGDIFVGWTSRFGTIATLKLFNSTRYATLTWGQNSAVSDGIT